MKPPKHLQHDVIKRVAATITDNHLLKDGDKVIVGVSGGADSVALLCVLQAIQIKLQLIAVYVDHGLRPTEVPFEIQTISEHCKALNVPFIVESIDVLLFAKKEKRSIEDSARILRYTVFHELLALHSAQAIAVGHNADDQVEEFFLRAIRGSSRKSLSGMELQNGSIIRPLLHLHKAELTGYLEKNSIPWCMDSSNLEREYLRNKVRLDLLPLLEKDFNASIGKTILQNMDILREEERYLEANTVDAYQKCITPDIDSIEDINREQLKVQSELFLKYHPAIQRRIVEKCCWKMKSKASYEQIRALIELIDKGTNGAELHLPAGLRVEKNGEGITFSRPLPPGQNRGSAEPAELQTKNIPAPGTYLFQGLNRKLILEEVATAKNTRSADVLHIDIATIDFPLVCRSSLPGERFHPLGAPGTKKITRFYNDKKIPAKKRASCPVLFSGNRVIALPGLEIAEGHKVSKATTSALRIRWVTIDKDDRENS